MALNAALTAERRMPRATGNVVPVWRVAPLARAHSPPLGAVRCVSSVSGVARGTIRWDFLQCAAALAVVATERAFLRAL